MAQHDCVQVLSKVFLALDGELTEAEEKEFYLELQRCSCCLNHFNIEKAFKEFLCQKIQRKEVNPDLIVSIREKIRQIQID
ncbi:MAG: hypothetical protein KatS3mg031_2370 [Chitinophagales bacterium]|nr:MAG: hypothetical protein KatS3mg031_2370 [Chitinophagales bacterium]